MGVEGSRGFCAGGDVKDIVAKGKSGKPEEIAQALKFFEEEYKLNHLIGTLKKPFISLMNGIVSEYLWIVKLSCHTLELFDFAVSLNVFVASNSGWRRRYLCACSLQNRH
jgi:hypothetical protein